MGDIDFTALTPLVLYAMWAPIQLFLLFFARAGAMSGGKRAINSFKAVGDTESLDAFSRAHMNTIENLPVFAVLYVLALWIGADAPLVTLAWIVLAARIIQSVVHMSSRSPTFVRVRASMQAVQILLFLWIGVATLIAIYADKS